MNEDNNGNNIENEFEKKGLINYLGAIIGGIVALVLCFTQFYRFLLNIVIVFGGMFIGNYVQKNKSHVKEKLKVCKLDINMEPPPRAPPRICCLVVVPGVVLLSHHRHRC